MPVLESKSRDLTSCKSPYSAHFPRIFSSASFFVVFRRVSKVVI